MVDADEWTMVCGFGKGLRRNLNRTLTVGKDVTALEQEGFGRCPLPYSGCATHVPSRIRAIICCIVVWNSFALLATPTFETLDIAIVAFVSSVLQEANRAHAPQSLPPQLV